MYMCSLSKKKSSGQIPPYLRFSLQHLFIIVKGNRISCAGVYADALENKVLSIKLIFVCVVHQ